MLFGATKTMCFLVKLSVVKECVKLIDLNEIIRSIGVMFWRTASIY